MSELSPAKLALFNPSPSPYISYQSSCRPACPRLSIDWGYAFSRPLLSPYETAVVVGRVQGWEEQERYPMEFYEAGSLWALSRVKGADVIEL
jgi:2-(3-amino-3-carboxypropyl)histidine synthase